MGERVVRNDEVRGSIPLGSTKSSKHYCLVFIRQISLPDRIPIVIPIQGTLPSKTPYALKYKPVFEPTGV